jgi:hypothetical protein
MYRVGLYSHSKLVRVEQRAITEPTTSEKHGPFFLILGPLSIRTCHRDRIQRGPASHLLVYVENKNRKWKNLKTLGSDWLDRIVVLFFDWWIMARDGGRIYAFFACLFCLCGLDKET